MAISHWSSGPGQLSVMGVGVGQARQFSTLLEQDLALGPVVTWAFPGPGPSSSGESVGLPQVAMLIWGASVAHTGPEEWRLVATTVMPALFDPASFPRRKVLALVLFGLFIFATAARAPRRSALRFSALFLGGLLAIAAVGGVARLAGWYQLLAITPFRTGPLFATLLFFVHLFAFWRNSRLGPEHRWVSFLALLGLVAIPSPMISAAESAQVTFRHSPMTVRAEPEQEPGLVRAMRWIADSTPRESTIILPPWRKDSFYRAQRAQIASWEAVRYENMQEWRNRIEAMVGPLPVGQKLPWTALRKPYYDLTQGTIRDLAHRYGAALILTRTGYPFPVRFGADSFAVYEITPR